MTGVAPPESHNRSDPPICFCNPHAWSQLKRILGKISPPKSPSLTPGQFPEWSFTTNAVIMNGLLTINELSAALKSANLSSSAVPHGVTYSSLRLKYTSTVETLCEGRCFSPTLVNSQELLRTMPPSCFSMLRSSPSWRFFISRGVHPAI